MAEVQTNTSMGEVTLRFIELIRMHSQNASLLLGRIPHPQTGKTQINLPLGRLLVEQLAAVAVKTRGNLTKEESEVLESSLRTLQEALTEASKAQKNP